MLETLESGIDLFRELERKATQTPWYLGDVYEDEYGCKYCPVGPYDMSDKAENTLTKIQLQSSGVPSMTARLTPS